MWYVIEQYQWDFNEKHKYYHLVDSKVFESDKEIEEKSYNKDGSTFLIYKTEDEIQNARRTKGTRTTKSISGTN